MPRTKLSAESDKNKDLSKLIRKYKYAESLNDEEAGKRIGVTGRTWSRYMNAPENLSIKTLRKIQKKLNIPKDEMIPFIL